MINICSTTPSTISTRCISRLLHQVRNRTIHAQTQKLISYRRHLPVPHYDSGQAHGHTPAAGPQPAPEGITAPGRSPKVRQTRQYECAKSNHEHDRLRQATTFDLCRMRLTNFKATDARPWERCLQNAVALCACRCRRSQAPPYLPLIQYLRQVPGLLAC